MKIQAIKQDAAGWKLIAAAKVVDNKKQKPSIGESKFFDYKNGVLRQYGITSSADVEVKNFKHALAIIFSI